MTSDGALDLFKKALFIIAQIAGPALLAALIVGIVVGVIQTATQVNESSVSFVLKLLAVVVVLVIGGPFILGVLIEYTRGSIQSISGVAR
jgi:flagellar biosynthetic protein FliQ